MCHVPHVHARVPMSRFHKKRKTKDERPDRTGVGEEAERRRKRKRERQMKPQKQKKEHNDKEEDEAEEGVHILAYNMFALR